MEVILFTNTFLHIFTIELHLFCNMTFKHIFHKFNQWVNWIGSIGIEPQDNAEQRSLKTILTIVHYVAIVNLLYFSVVYDAMGRRAVTYALIIFAVYLILNTISFRIHRNFRIFRNIIFAGYYVYIIYYQCLMGGYIGSTGYIFYGILVLNGMQLFFKDNAVKNAWYGLYMITAIVLYYLEPVVSKDFVPVSREFVLITYLNMFILIGSLTMLSTGYLLRIIKREQAKYEKLIRNILPESVVDEINEHQTYAPISVPLATVIFMDFVNFSKNTFSLSPNEIVAALNLHFSEFDQIFKDHNVEKLKTIGDGYMAVGGLPIQNQTHALNVGLAALSILKYVYELKKEKKLYDWDLRIGIHSGPMVAGIIGKTKFSYDVWGNSVNLCARFETTSKANCINVSQDYMRLTADFFDFEERGLIEIKNGEPTLMYFLKDIKQELRKEQYKPNDLFYEKYKAYTNA